MNEDENKAVEKDLLNLANANQEEPFDSNKAYDEMTDLSKNISDLIFELSNITEKASKKLFIDNDSRYSSRDTEVVSSRLLNIRQKFEELKKERDELTDKLLTILGTVYEGPLINDEISFRKGKIYRFRCRYTLELKRILDTMVKHKDEVVKKLNPQYQKTLVYIYEQYTKLRSFCSIDDLQAVSMIEKINKIDFVEPIMDDIGTGRGNFYKVDSFCLDGYGINFYYGETKQGLNYVSRILIEKVYAKQIEDVMNKFIENISVEHDKTKVMLEDVKVNYAKQLVYAELLAKKQDCNY